MQEIKAYIKPHKLTDVILALHRIEGLTGVSISDGRGYGRGRGEQAQTQIIQDMLTYVPHLRVEMSIGKSNDILAPALPYLNP